MKMQTPGAVLLLLWSGLVTGESGGLQDGATNAATSSTQQTCQPDIHTVLREMSTLMAEQRVELRHTKTQMEAMETRLRASEKTVEEQRVELRYTKTQMEAMETRLRASEKTVEEQRVELTQTEARLRASEKLVEQLKSENEAQAVNLNLTVSHVGELRREREERRVSFSASLLASGSGNTGPFSTATPLVYRHVITNIGSAYNLNTGVFTAPVRGVYYFVVFIQGKGDASTPTVVTLHKNGEQVLSVWSHQTSGSIKAANGASLLLEVGHVVYVKLHNNGWVYDDQNHHTTFSGYLLFPM